MDRFFSMDGKFFGFMSRLSDFFILSVLTIVCCIPIVTIGASLTAMFYVTLKMVRNEESYIVRSFFKSFRQNFRQATLINLIMLAVGAVLFIDMNIVKSLEGSAAMVLQVIFAILLFIYVMIFVYIYPILAKFYNTIKNTFRNAALMSIRHLPYTFLMLAITVCPFLTLFIQSAQIAILAMVAAVLFGPALVAYCNSCFFVKIFDKYLPAEEDSEAAADGDHS